MEFQAFPWHYLLASPRALFSRHTVPYNYVQWSQTPDSHIYSADLPGVKKEEIKVEIEDSKYMIIRTESVDETSCPAMSFMRKFRLPNMVDIDGISAKYEDGVLTVTVPRYFRRGFLIDHTDVHERLGALARAA